MTAGAGAVWAVSHDRATLLRIDPRSGRLTRRIPLPSDLHGVAFGSGNVWVALYHQSTILRVDPHTNRILGPPIGAGFPTEPLASAGGHLWAIPRWAATSPTPNCTPCWRSTPPAAASWAPTRRAAAPNDLVAAGNSVWVATTEPNEVVRFSSSAKR
jgi:streptogramin lyase